MKNFQWIHWKFFVFLDCFFAFLFNLCYDFCITDFSVLFSMERQQSQKLIDALMPLIGYWEYAEDIIANIRNWNISDDDAEELANLIQSASHQAKWDEEFIRMTIAYETSNFWKKKEQIENQKTKENIDDTLQILETL